jgi:hypothetical protein
MGKSMRLKKPSAYGVLLHSNDVPAASPDLVLPNNHLHPERSPTYTISTDTVLRSWRRLYGYGRGESRESACAATRRRVCGRCWGRRLRFYAARGSTRWKEARGRGCVRAELDAMCRGGLTSS